MTAGLFAVRRRFGHIPDPAHKATGEDVGALVGASALLPTWVTVPRPADFDDQREASCVARALRRAIRIAGMRQGLNLDPSALAPYVIGRQLEHPDLDVLPDNGSLPYRALEALRQWGVISRSRWPDSSDPTSPVPQDVLEAGSLSLLSGVYRVFASGADRLQQIRQALANGHSVTFAMPVEQAFEDGPGQGCYLGMTGTSKGSHMMLIVGYGPGYFLVDNSWGPDWNRTGSVRISEDWIAGALCSDFIVVTVAPSTLL